MGAGNPQWLMAATVLAWAVALAYAQSSTGAAFGQAAQRSLLQGGSCPSWGGNGQGLTSKDRESPIHVFSELTTKEMNDVFSFLLKQKSLNLTDMGKLEQVTDAYVNVNYLHGMWYQIPKKADVLKHLDQGGPVPPRFARVQVIQGATNPPVVREVLVNLPNPSQLIDVPIHGTDKKNLPITYRPQGVMDSIGLFVAFYYVQAEMNAFFKEAFNGYQYGEECGTKCLRDNLGCYQYLSPDAPRVLYVWFLVAIEDGDGGYLHPIPFQAMIRGSGASLDEWRVDRVWFNFKWYKSMKELLDAWRAPNSAVKATFKWREPTGADKLYSAFKPRPGPKRGENQPVGPIPFEPYGRRFTITQGNKVEWLGWSLYAGAMPTSGPRLFDVRFKGQRIAYEVSMQEALAAYGAGDLAQANTLYLDSHWGIGASYRELLHGIDCPLNAAYMDTVTWYKGNERPVLHKNSVCVFEMDLGLPVIRHYSYSYDFYGAVKSWALVIRAVAEVYNYDYIVDTMLYVDGTLETKVQTSGYVQANVVNRNYPNRFGYPLSYGVGGTIHNHHLAWKVDLDIAGTANSVRIHEVKMGEADTGYGGKAWVHYYDVKTAEKEDDTGIVSNYARPKLPVIVNENAKNKWGSPRGYKIQVNRVAHELMPEQAPYKQSMGFARYTFVATQQKDMESHSSSIYSQGRLADPVIRLENFVNGESVRNQDIVAWVSAGLYHIPAAEDAPVTPTTGNAIGFSLIPFNFGDENLATDMADMIQVQGATEETLMDKAASRCTPSFSKIPFLKDGFEEV